MEASALSKLYIAPAQGANPTARNGNGRLGMGHPISASGTNRKCQSASPMSAFEGNPDGICLLRALPLMTDAVEKGLRTSPNSDSADSMDHVLGGGDDGSAVRR